VTAIHSAAGALLATEAGGALTDIDGGPWTLESDSLVAAASPETLADLLALVATSEAR
jgi:myo-inositol-1(or 4)-monophosphatase